jgi:hypothetical protein
MKKEERKLTEKERQRKEKFEALCAQMEREGYAAKPMTVGVLKANILAVVIMLPFAALMVWLYYVIDRTVDLSFLDHVLVADLLFLALLVCLVVLHELIHGLTWGIFAQSHWKSIDFGVIWSMLTPYCTCSEPLKKGQYLLGSAMPTLILGFGLGFAAILCRQFLLFALAEIMIFGGGGDFIIILKMLLYRAKGKDAVYYDHPYECGFVVFEKVER